ncbi:TVP38/TMEM64 family protein [Vreelandella andesensis]|uniref:TVP38/TMEM64 family membrane protein n=1 Tax=Vreelandella andesensis TaxID=447567 RepID=A0A433KQY6_9GAMM|nr:TVP38/TMEM64 family protein [Halomonas andesensis]RUR32075.1 TVP38/TMEM64 family protein [Halomonas andesensis]
MSPTLLKGIGLVIALVILGIMWRWLQQQGLLTQANLSELASTIGQWKQAPWMFAAVIGIYTGSLLVMFPLSLLVVLTGLLFGPFWGLAYATLGTLSSSVVSYWVGHWMGRDALMHYGGRHLRGLSGYLSKRGIRTMTIINLLPLAPFTLTNMLAGAFHLKFRDYMIGSTLGIVPGLAAVILLGSQLGALFSAASRQEWVLAMLGLSAGVGLLWLLKRIATSRSAKSKNSET